jgi:GntR family transcriptional regulator of vanillate catabolism
MNGDPMKAGRASQSLAAILGVRELILEGELRPGERVSELWLVDRLGVSRTPVRAALVRLEHEGLLETLPSGGYAVRRFSDEEVADAIELRGAMEGLAARRAAERGVSPQQLSELRLITDQLDQVLKERTDRIDFDSYVELNWRFHAKLVQIAGSSVFAEQIERIQALPFASPSAFVEAQTEMQESLDILIIAQSQHRAVVEAIELREGARAEALMREHARIARTNLALVAASDRLKRRVPDLSLVDTPK